MAEIRFRNGASSSSSSYGAAGFSFFLWVLLISRGISSFLLCASGWLAEWREEKNQNLSPLSYSSSGAGGERRQKKKEETKKGRKERKEEAGL